MALWTPDSRQLSQLTSRQTNRFNYLNKRNPKRAKQFINDRTIQYVAPPSTTPLAPAAPAAPDVPPVAESPVSPPLTQETPPNTGGSGFSLRDLLFGPTGSIIPQNVTSSPLYNYRQQQGEKSIDRALASQGLRKSGTQVQAYSDLSSKLFGEESDRIMQQENQARQQAISLALDEANRQERISNEDFNRITTLLGMYLGQDPTNAGLAGASGTAEALTGMGKAEQAILSKIYKRPTLGISSGGGGQSIPSFVQPYPNRPNTSDLDVLASLNKTGQNTDWLNFGSGIISSLF